MQQINKMGKGGASMVLTEESKKNLDAQFNKLKEKAPHSVTMGIVKMLFDIKFLAQNKLKADRHIVTSRLRNSLYVQINTDYLTAKKVYDQQSAKGGNSETYSDNEGKSYNSELNVELNKNQGAVGTNVEYAAAIEYGYAAHEIEAKNFKQLGNPKVGWFGKKVKHPGFKGDSFLYWAAKNVNVSRRVSEMSKELLGDLTKQGRK